MRTCSIFILVLFVVGCKGPSESLAGTFKMVPNEGTTEMKNVAPMRLTLVADGTFEIQSGNKVTGKWRHSDDVVSLTMNKVGDREIRAGSEGSQIDLKVEDSGNTLVPPVQKMTWRRE